MQVIDATRAHARALGPKLRELDLAEAVAFGFTDAADVLEQSLEASDVKVAILFNGKVAAIAGVAPFDSPGALGSPRADSGCVWLLTGELVDQYPMSFFRLGRPLLRGFLEHYAYLFNWVDVRYTKALRFAEHLGFELLAAEPVGPSGRLGRYIHLTREA